MLKEFSPRSDSSYLQFNCICFGLISTVFVHEHSVLGEFISCAFL